MRNIVSVLRQVDPKHPSSVAYGQILNDIYGHLFLHYKLGKRGYYLTNWTVKTPSGHIKIYNAIDYPDMLGSYNSKRIIKRFYPLSNKVEISENLWVLI